MQTQVEAKHAPSTKLVSAFARHDWLSLGMQHSKEVQHAPLLLDKDDSADNRSCLRDRIHREIYALAISHGGQLTAISPIASEGILGEVTDTNGRRVPSYLVELAQRYIKLKNSEVPAFELAILGWTDETLRKTMVAALEHGLV